MAAFEKSSTGDPDLLTVEESLRRSVDLLLNTDDLFAVEGQGELTGDLKAAHFISILKNQRQVNFPDTGTSKYKTGVDRVQFVEKKEGDFFTDANLPTFDPVSSLLSVHRFNQPSTLREGAGKVGNLKLLEMYKTDPNILVHMGICLIEPHSSVLRVARSTLTKYLYEVQR